MYIMGIIIATRHQHFSILNSKEKNTHTQNTRKHKTNWLDSEIQSSQLRHMSFHCFPNKLPTPSASSHLRIPARIITFSDSNPVMAGSWISQFSCEPALICNKEPNISAMLNHTKSKVIRIRIDSMIYKNSRDLLKQRNLRIVL